MHISLKEITFVMIIFIGKDNFIHLNQASHLPCLKSRRPWGPNLTSIKRQGLFCVFKKLISLQSV